MRISHVSNDEHSEILLHKRGLGQIELCPNNPSSPYLFFTSVSAFANMLDRREAIGRTV